jgi:tetratricopeptide (TPR) repeat protein
MDDILQNQIEDYVAGLMPEKTKLEFEEKIKSDLNLHQQVEDLKCLREAMLRAKIRANVANARAHVNKPKRGLTYVLGTFGAAAAMILFLLSTSITFAPKKFNYRGDGAAVGAETQVRANDYEKATRLVEENENLPEAIKILERLKTDENVSKNYQNESKWLLVVSYLRIGEAEKAEKVFNEVKWEDAGRPFSTWEIGKIHWQIFWGKIF